MPYRAPIDVTDYIAALGDDEVELKHTVTLSKSPVHYTQPYVWGDGPVVSSTCTEVARIDDARFIWDVNHYYRDLGFTWPYRGITKRALREAYRDLNGPGSTRLTYVFKQLLNPAVREDYDTMPLGEPFWDAYWTEHFKGLARDDLKKAKREGIDLSEADALAQYGLGDSNEPEQENIEPDFTDFENEFEGEEVPFEDFEWDWSFYVHRSESVNLKRLAMWQRLLVRRLNMNQRYGKTTMPLTWFAVGVMGYGRESTTPRTRWEVIDRQIVYFLRNDVEPNDEDAREIVRASARQWDAGMSQRQWER